MIRLCSFFTDQPSSTNRVASQSSSSGCVGGSLRTPKSLGVRTSACAEVVHPDAVDHHAGGQRVVGRGDRLRQFQPAAAVRERLALRPGDDLGELPRHRRAAVVRVAAQEDDRLGRLRGVGEHHRPRRGGRGVRLELVDLLLQLVGLVAVGAVEQPLRPLYGRGAGAGQPTQRRELGRDPRRAEVGQRLLPLRQLRLERVVLLRPLRPRRSAAGPSARLELAKTP